MLEDAITLYENKWIPKHLPIPSPAPTPLLSFSPLPFGSPYGKSPTPSPLSSMSPSSPISPSVRVSFGCFGQTSFHCI